MQILTKYHFHIKTKTGITVNPIIIPAQNQSEAEVNLFQMYPGSKIISVENCQGSIDHTMEYQEVLDIITNA